MDEGAGGEQGRPWQWAIGSPCRSGRMRRGGVARQEPYGWMDFRLVFWDLVLRILHVF
jgi:hypothetical protein